MSGHTVATLIEAVCHQFQAAGLSYGHGTDNPWDEAVALVLRVSGAPDDASVLDQSVPEDQVEQILDYAETRVRTRAPLAYLLGGCHYMGFDFDVEPGVVVPRSPIGYLLHEGLTPWLPVRVNRILDLCSGSGCLGIVAAHLFTEAHVTLLELDPLALEVARGNVRKHDLDDRVSIVAGDVTAAPAIGPPYDLIISNPPYVDASDMRTLPPEFRAEPEQGLAAGTDGLAIMGAILTQLPDWLAPGGLFVGEVGASAPALLHKYADLPLIWPDLPAGGEGVFILEADALTSHTSRGF